MKTGYVGGFLTSRCNTRGADRILVITSLCQLLRPISKVSSSTGAGAAAAREQESALVVVGLVEPGSEPVRQLVGLP